MTSSKSIVTLTRGGVVALIAVIAVLLLREPDDEVTQALPQPENDPQSQASAADWISLFDGATLAGWVPKVRGFPAGENPFDTFKVEEGLLTVAYDGYDRFDDQFGHIFYHHPYSHYRLRLEYRFVGEQAPAAPG